MSTRQLAMCVRHDRPITLRMVMSQPISIKGWLCGWDDYHWAIVDARGEVTLVHKSTCYVIIPSPEAVYDDPPDEAKKILASFKMAVEREHFGSTHGNTE